ncbi:Flp family type IVb pilin [Nocardioides jishulii]|uniref:Flp family type IVb pilin n=1 Tax=Nocardioides jishulii TaxID=2575440 RepID=A0A4U2YVN6_9ACTN|nr:hypothetical protein [Nocardioides jishulii]QCX28295.1 hypothetical protein FCL41_12775 [Nocardioides jishulii]TKI64812.1 hypothetical protein FC770_06795 [Nocardioides jishulii]
MTSQHIQFLVIMLNGRLAAARKDERGVSAVEWVVISGLVALIAFSIYGILRSRLEGKANNLQLDP